MATAYATPVHTTVVGVFSDSAHAQTAIDELRRAGFRDDRIGFLGPGQPPPAEPAEAAGEGRGGAGVGAALGASLGGVAGLTAAAAMVPPLGAVAAGGAILTFLGSVAGGAVAGGLAGRLIEAGIPEEDSRWFEGELKAGRTMVTVHEADERAEDAREILRRNDGTIREPSPIGTYGTGLPATPY